MIPIPAVSPRMVAYAAVVALFFAVLGFAGCEHKRAEREVQKRLAAEAQVVQVVDANKTLKVTVDTQAAALTEWAKLGITAKELTEIKRMLDEREAKLAREAEKFLKLKEKDRANPECAAMLALDFGRACPGIARRLRDYESGHADADR